MKKHKILIASVFLALIAGAGCVPTDSPINGAASAAPRPQGQKPIVIGDDRGGNVMDAVRRRSQLQRWGGPVEVRGYCRSACTLYITLPNACLGPKAIVGFHAPRLPGTTIIPPAVDQIMASYYRNGILRRWNNEWKHSLDMHKITAAEYVRLDPQTRLCATPKD